MNFIKIIFCILNLFLLCASILSNEKQTSFELQEHGKWFNVLK